ncbi:MAG: nickel-dependent hydrogenase large subunit [Polyangiaceae bacterium]
MSKNARTIRVDALARVEGEGALTIRFRGTEPKSVELTIFEPPRFFEGFLRGRSLFETPDITARICGICPVAYQMSACHALEDAVGAEITPEIRRLRRLLYTGEWIESHVLHMFMLHAPDFLGYDDAIGMAKEHADLVKASLRMKKAGNAIVALLGGREIHPINVCVGGFHRAPTKSEMRELLPELEWSRTTLENVLTQLSAWHFPDYQVPIELVSLWHADEYPFNEGRIRSSSGLDVDVHEYEAHFQEEHVQRSTALHSVHVGHGAYLVGPLARFNNCFAQLRPVARACAERLGLVPPMRNPFRSLLIRGIETLEALDEACEIVERYEVPRVCKVDVPIRAGVGQAATEAPRGLLYHRYRGRPGADRRSEDHTAHESESEAHRSGPQLEIARRLAALPHAEARRLAEQTVRNYDPCISCSTHFLDLRIESEA